MARVEIWREDLQRWLTVPCFMGNANQRDVDDYAKRHPGSVVRLSEDIVVRLRKRAEIRRGIPDRKSVQEGKPDRIADLLDEAANIIEKLRQGLE